MEKVGSKEVQIAHKQHKVRVLAEGGGVGMRLAGLPCQFCLWVGCRLLCASLRPASRIPFHLNMPPSPPPTQNFLPFPPTQQVNYFHVHERGVDWVFADHDVYNRPGSPYADPAGVPFGDNVFRFHLLCMAALEAPLVLPIGSCR